MSVVSPKYIVLLLVVAIFAVKVQLSNPHKKYSTDKYWQTATVASVVDVPDEALAHGNKNGGILMWAAMGATDPQIIRALVDRGADVNESDLLSGTPLSGAAGRTTNPAIIRELVELGADVKQRVGLEHTVLMIAAMYNSTSGVFEELIAQGVDVNATNEFGETALDLARKHENATAVVALSTSESVSTRVMHD